MTFQGASPGGSGRQPPSAENRPSRSVASPPAGCPSGAGRGSRGICNLHSTARCGILVFPTRISQQVALLQKYVPYKLVVNQLQLSICHTNMIDGWHLLSTWTFPRVSTGMALFLDYCRLNDMTIQAWSPFQWGFTEGVFVGDMERYPELNEVMDKVAKKYGVTKNAIATGWIARHPANMQIILGTTNSQRLIESCPRFLSLC